MRVPILLRGLKRFERRQDFYPILMYNLAVLTRSLLMLSGITYAKILKDWSISL